MTPDQRADILDSLRAGCTLDAAAKASRTTGKTCRDLAAIDPEWRAAMLAAVPDVEAAPPEPRAMTLRELAAMQAEEPPPAYVPLEKAQTYVPKPTLAEGEDIPDWEKFAQEAADEFGPGRMGLYLKQDARLVQRGIPATSPWWRWTINEYFGSGKTWLIAMVGRGGGKSTTLERFLLSIIMHTPRVAPPSQEWQCPIVSVRPEDARRRINEIQVMLRMAYFLETKVSSGAVKVTDSHGNPIEIASMAATIGNVSGASTVCVIIDEAAKLASDGANSDTEMVTSLAETSRARQGWAGVRCSSAWQTKGSHFASVTQGSNLVNYVATIGPDFIDAALAGLASVAAFEAAQGNSHGAAQIRAFAKTLTPKSPNVPTWVANPTISAMDARMIIETLPEEEGLSKVDLFLRESASMPLAKDSGPDYAAQCSYAADITARLAGRQRPGAPGGVNENGLIINPSAPPGDARYGGPAPRKVVRAPGWRARKVF